jgi:glucuronate isomerase
VVLRQPERHGALLRSGHGNGGLYNTAGFNDDTRAFCSIPARHDVWRRASANWLAGLVVRHIIDMDDAHEMIRELAVGLAKRRTNFKALMNRFEPSEGLLGAIV